MSKGLTCTTLTYKCITGRRLLREQTSPLLFRRRLLQDDTKEGEGCEEIVARREEEAEEVDPGCADAEEEEEEEEQVEENPYMNMTLLRVFPCQPGYCLGGNSQKSSFYQPYYINRQSC